jgi:chemotaxis signal transduction protein
MIELHPHAMTEHPAGDAVLLIRLGSRRYGLPLPAVERVLPMAAVVPLPDSAPSILGVLNVHGAVLPVIDPRHRLGLPSPTVSPEHRLILLSTAGRRFLLWVDAVDDVVVATPDLLTAAPSPDTSSLTAPRVGDLTPRVLRLDDGVVPILAPEALDGARVGATNGGAVW